MSSKVKKHIPRNRFGERIQFIRVTKAMQTFEGVRYIIGKSRFLEMPHLHQEEFQVLVGMIL